MVQTAATKSWSNTFFVAGVMMFAGLFWVLFWYEAPPVLWLLIIFLPIGATVFVEVLREEMSKSGSIYTASAFFYVIIFAAFAAWALSMEILLLKDIAAPPLLWLSAISCNAAVLLFSAVSVYEKRLTA